jgi:hypothetical protein
LCFRIAGLPLNVRKPASPNSRRILLILPVSNIAALEDPDPFGSTLLAVRRYLSTLEDADDCGLFWE